jgi:hypothetical protein
MIRIFTLCLFLTYLPAVRAAVVKGTVTDEQGLPLPMVNIVLKGKSSGTTTDQRGNYQMQLSAGTHKLVFSFVGYERQEISVTLKTNEVQELNVQLIPSAEQLTDFTVSSDYKDFAREIVRKAREYRKIRQDLLKAYSTTAYQKVSLQKEYREKYRDSLLLPDSTWQVTDTVRMKREADHLVEAVSTFHYDPPGKKREDFAGFFDHSEVRIREDVFRGGNVGFTIEYGESSITPSMEVAVNSYVLLRDEEVFLFDLYDNLINVPSVCSKQIQSPLAGAAALNYIIDYGGETEYLPGKKAYKILVRPTFPGEALFEGTLVIADSSFALVACELSVNPRVLTFCEEFHVSIKYTEVSPGIFLPSLREYRYVIKEGKKRIYGTINVRHLNTEANPTFPPSFFTSEIRRYDDLAYERDSTWWAGVRAVPMDEYEREFIRQKDSLRDYYDSDEYYRKRDSSFNRINIWSFLVNGVGHRDRVKGYEFFINPLVAQMIPFGIGGYRHRLGGYYNKRLDNGMLLETTGEIDYGFANKDVKGKGGIGLTYDPKRFTRTFIRFGDFYEMINNYASVSTFLSRSNFARNRMFSIAQRTEIINGLYGELTYEYSDQQAIAGMKMDSWSQDIFGELNSPTEFQRYTKSEFKLQLTYRIRQPYTIRRGRKLVYYSPYPELSFVYRKGLPGLFGSEVNFDYLEIGAKNQRKLARLGDIKWNVQAGSFVNRNNLRLLEYKFFRGSDPFLFSDPLKSFQLMGPTLSTSTAYFRANVIHHFDGIIMSKIPLVNRLKITLAAGGGTLMIPDEDFAHIEVFGGIERVFRIRRQLIRFGAYAITADNTFDNPEFEFKFGISFFNPFTGRYDY